jgi:hypothetical protein
MLKIDNFYYCFQTNTFLVLICISLLLTGLILIISISEIMNNINYSLKQKPQLTKIDKSLNKKTNIVINKHTTKKK